MKLSVTTSAPNINKALPLSLLSGDFLKRLQKASSLGYNGIELVVHNPDTINPKIIISSLKNSGLEIAAVSTGGLSFLENITLISPENKIRKKASAYLTNLISFANKVGAPLITIGSFRGRFSETSYVDDKKYFVEILRDLLELAQRNNVRLAIEPLNRYECNFLNNVDETLSFIDENGYSNLGILFDTFHANIEEASIIESLLKVNTSQKLWHIHIGDNNRYPPGLGHIDFPSILNTLREIKYDDYISAELMPFPDPDEAAKITVEYLKPFLSEKNK